MSKLKEEELLTMLGMAVQNAIEYFVINKDKEFMAKIPKLQQAHLQIREMIQKPGVTEEWIELKAQEIYEKISKLNPSLPTYSFLNIAIDFIRKLVKER